MSEYTPDAWVIVRLPNGEGFKAIGGWSGGYLYGDSWRVNSGITKIEDGGDVWLVHGHTGSVYRLHKGGARVSMALGSVLHWMEEHGCEMVDIEEVIREL